MTPSFFETPAALRAWLRQNHAAASALWIGFYKARSDRTGVTYKQALDEALCQGWIDGVRKTIDEARWTIRFTPRKAGSVWSLINRKRAAELLTLGRMTAAGRRAFAAREEAPKRRYSYESQPRSLAAAHQRAFRADRAAWAFFETQPPSYRKKAVFWVESAVQEKTRERRLRALMAASREGVRLGELSGRAASGTRGASPSGKR